MCPQSHTHLFQAPLTQLFPCLVPAALQESPLKNFFVFFSLTFFLAALLSIAEHGLSLVVAQGLLSLQ